MYGPVNTVNKVILDTETPIVVYLSYFFFLIIMRKKTLLIQRGCGGGRGALNPLPLLPLKLRSVEDLLPFGGFSAGNRLLCGAIVASTGALRRKYCWEWSDFPGGGVAAGYGAGGGRVLPLPLAVVVELVIFGFRE